FESLVLNLIPREFANVKSLWMWEDNPFDSRRDTGIDIVVQTNNDELWAIQCKAYSGSVSKRDLDSFYADSSHSMYQRKMVFATTDQFSKNAVEKANDLGV